MTIAFKIFGCRLNQTEGAGFITQFEAAGFERIPLGEAADVILVYSCTVTQKAENECVKTLRHLRATQPCAMIVLAGCAAETCDRDVLKGVVDLFVGREQKENLVELIGERLGKGGRRREEGGGKLQPRLSTQRATLKVQDGCSFRCSYCIVPYTRGRERSRDVESIVNELKDLQSKNYKEVTLLGQNVNSYRIEKDGEVVEFPDLLRIVAEAAPEIRFRFSTSHPKDMSDRTLETIAQYHNLCKSIHLPVQSGSDKILKLMNRKYTREWYLERIDAIHRILPEASISTDVFCGFHGETEEDHQETLSLLREVNFDLAFMFKYSERPGTYAAKNLPDNISEKEKLRRLAEIIDVQRELTNKGNQLDIGKTFEVLVEGFSKKSKEQLFGRTSQNKVVIFPRINRHIGETIQVKILSASSAALIGEVVD